MAKRNQKTKPSRSHRLGAFTRRHTIGKAKSIGKAAAKAAKAAKSVAGEFKDGFNAESKS